jgi:hypothetical protein
MTYRPRVATLLYGVVAVGTLVVAALTPSLTSFAQELEHLQPAPSPLELQSRGSFLVGGGSVLQTPAQLSYFTGQLPDTGGHATTNQMYVEYMVPVADNGVPVIMLHGATLTGKSYDTTPDRRMGWYEYFVRQGHPTYVPDQISRGRSGFGIAMYNAVRAGELPLTALPNFWRFTDEFGVDTIPVWSELGYAVPGRAVPGRSRGRAGAASGSRPERGAAQA